MDDKVLCKLARAEEDLVSAMLAGERELAAYDLAWTSLLDEISHSSALGIIDSTTLAVARDVVSRVSTLVDHYSSLSSVPEPFPVLDLRARSPSPLHSASAFIPEAYSWLLDNIANPYPPSVFKATLAQRSNSPVSAVSSWFANARRRMGWTSVCRDYFKGCRADAVNAAYRALVKEDANHPLPPDVLHAFIGVKDAAEGLYSSTFTKSALAGDLDAVVKDVTDQDSILADERKRCELKEIVEFSADVGLQKKKLVAQNYYPSPDRSRSPSPVPGLDESLTDESEDEEDVSPPILAGRKRRLSTSEPAHVASSRMTTRPVKRLRPSFSSSSANACLPSPSTTAEESLENDSRDQMPHPAPLAQNSTNVTAPRKRRLSDADATEMPKRPRGLMAGPRLHAVSDPLPLSTLESEYSIDEWFNTNFDTLFALPPPVDVAEPDLSTQWEVELFNNYSIPKYPQKRPSKSLTPPIQDDLTSTSTDLTALEDLLQSLESGGFVALPELLHPSTMVSGADADAVSHGPPLSSDLSQSIDWTTLLNEQTSEPAVDSAFPQPYANSSLPQIDLSILQLPQVPTKVTSQTAFNEGVISRYHTY